MQIHKHPSALIQFIGTNLLQRILRKREEGAWIKHIRDTSKIKTWLNLEYFPIL